MRKVTIASICLLLVLWFLSLHPVMAGFGRSSSESFQWQQELGFQEGEIRLKKEQLEFEKQKLHIQICEDLYPFGADQLKECIEEILRELK